MHYKKMNKLASTPPLFRSTTASLVRELSEKLVEKIRLGMQKNEKADRE